MKLIVRFLITLSISIFIISFFSFGIQAVTDSPSISMSSSSVQQGNQVTLSVSIANMTPYSGLDVSVFYDEDNFEVSYIYYSGLYDSINHQKDVNDTNPGIINYVMITPTNTELNGTIMNIVFKAKNDALIQSHLFYIAVNNAFNQQLETISMQIENGSVLVTEKDVAIQSIYYYQSISDANLEIGDTFTWQIYSYNTYSVSASQYEFYYPRTNIKINSIDIGDSLKQSNVLYDLNDAQAGYINLAFASPIGLTNIMPLITITFEVILDDNAQFNLSFNPSQAYSETHSPLGGNDLSYSIVTLKKPVEIIYPSIKIDAYQGYYEDSFDINLTIDSGSNLGAGDFTLYYPSDLVSADSVTSLLSEGYLLTNIVESEHKITFSIIDSDGIQTETPLLKITFTPKVLTPKTFDLSMSGSGVVDQDLNAITLEYPNSTIQLKQGYVIDFINYDGSLIDSQTVLSNVLPLAPTPTTRNFTVFNGWDKEIIPATGNATYQAKYLIDIDNIPFTNTTLIYNGSHQQITIPDLPEGLDIAYNQAIQKDVGTYTVEATLTLDGYDQVTKTANLTIKPKNITVTLLPLVGYDKMPLPEILYTTVGLITGDELTIEILLDSNTIGTHNYSANITNSNYIIDVIPSTITINPFPYQIGDVTLDDMISVIDIAYIQLHIANLKLLQSFSTVSADFNEDGEISITDAALIQLHLAGLYHNEK